MIVKFSALLSMNEAALYESFNEVQRFDSARILQEYAALFHWPEDGSASLLDVGCGAGDVLVDFIYPLLPHKFAKVTGIDCSSNMIRYAKKRYSEYRQLDFQVVDITTDELPVNLLGKFDRITSFYCLHWVQEQSKALQNVHKLLRPAGDCLLVFLASNFVFDVYEALAAKAKWQSFMQDLPKFIAPQHHAANAAAEFEELLLQAGFQDVKVELRSEIFTYVGEHNFKNNVRAVCPFLNRMSVNLQEEFLDDFMQVVQSLNLLQRHENAEKTSIISPYKLLVAYAKKS